MNKLICRVWPIAGLIVDILLAIDLADSLRQKIKDRKLRKATIIAADSEDYDSDE